MERGDCREFMELTDAVTCANNTVVSLIGVILDFGEYRRTNGTDYSCKLKIVDKTHTSPFSVEVYASHMDLLPHVASYGDIILLWQVKIKKPREVYAIFNKRVSSFVLFEGKDCDDFIPYQIYSQYSPREEDKNQITCLRIWWIDFKLDRGPMNYLLLRELEEENHVFLVCKVLHKCKVADSKWMVFLWDGTDAPPRGLVTPLQDEMDKPLPLHLGNVFLSRDILCAFPVIGTILRVEVDECYLKRALHEMETGSWMKLLNVSCKVEAGLWRVIVGRFSKLRCVSNEDSHVLERQRQDEERLSGLYGSMPYWSYPWPSCITEVGHDEVRSRSLMEILTGPKVFDKLAFNMYPKVTAKFKTTVRFLAARPWRVEDFRTSGTYKVRFTIEDATARIHAYAYARDGDEFFGNFEVDILESKRNRLLGIVGEEKDEKKIGSGRNPPWVQCCIKSYYTDKQNQWGSRRYRIFDTKLVLPDHTT